MITSSTSFIRRVEVVTLRRQAGPNAIHNHLVPLSASIHAEPLEPEFAGSDRHLSPFLGVECQPPQYCLDGFLARIERRCLRDRPKRRQGRLLRGLKPRNEWPAEHETLSRVRAKAAVV